MFPASHVVVLLETGKSPCIEVCIILYLLQFICAGQLDSWYFPTVHNCVVVSELAIIFWHTFFVSPIKTVLYILWLKIKLLDLHIYNQLGLTSANFLMLHAFLSYNVSTIFFSFSTRAGKRIKSAQCKWSIPSGFSSKAREVGKEPRSLLHVFSILWPQCFHQIWLFIEGHSKHNVACEHTWQQEMAHSLQKKNNTIDQEIFTLKIICVKFFCGDKFSWFVRFSKFFCIKCFYSYEHFLERE